MSAGSERRSVWRVGLVVVGVAVLMSCLAGAVAPAAPQPRLSAAPVNPEFLAYYDDLMAGRVQSQTADGHGLGYIPPPLDLSHLTGQRIFDPYRLLAPPPTYDLRDLGRLTPVKDQGSAGSCWAFATYGSMESCLLPSETWNFSENNLKNTHGWDWAHDVGGNHLLSAAYLARWSGPVAEADDPYNPLSGVSPSGLRPRKHVPEIPFLPGRAGSLDNDTIKQAVIDYGAVYSTMWWDGGYWNPATDSYYNYGVSSSNHAICIVGWDDTFAAANFLTAPPGNGAFIIRNSWGAAWGEAGYFYISYYDVEIGLSNVVFNETESVYANTIVHQYDPLGWVAVFGYGGTEGWFANIFTADSNQLIDAASFYSASVDSTYVLYLYLDSTQGPRSGTLEATKSGTISLPGYHTIAFDSPVWVWKGDQFSVVVDLTTPGYTSPIPGEQQIEGYTSGATANAGESFCSSDGTSWDDLTDYYPANVCLKAFGLPPALGTDTAGLYDATAGKFYLRNANSAGAADATFRFGPAPSTWTPIGGDWNFDDADTIGLYAPSTGTFFLKNTNAGGAADATFRFGPAPSTWTPIVGDWDGDGVGTIGLYNPSTGTFYLRNANSAGAADLTFRFGPTSSTWLPVVGDWEGDGKESVGLYNPTTGTFYLRSQNAAGSADYTFRFGPTSSAWKPLAGDWDDNCVDTVGLYNATTGTYYLRNDNSAGAANVTFRYGPAPSAWKPMGANWNGL